MSAKPNSPPDQVLGRLFGGGFQAKTLGNARELRSFE